MTELLERPSDVRTLPEVAADRLTGLFDSWQLVEHADGVLTAHGEIGGIDAYAFATDPSVQGGALGIDSCRAIAEITDRAVVDGIPVVGLWHSGGARLREGVAGLAAVAEVFAAETRASGSVFQLSVILGPAAGGAVYGPALTDLIILGGAGRAFVTGPDVVRKVTGEDVDMDRLGGPVTHTRSGVAHLTGTTEADALRTARRMIGMVADPGSVNPRRVDGPDPRALVPTDHRLSYDIRPVIGSVLDRDSFVELQAGWGRSAVVGVGRLAGRTVGVVANQPNWMAGCLDAETGDKTGRFVQWCSALRIPLVFLVDVPGYLPGVGQEDTAVIRRGAKLLHAYAAAGVPRVTVVMRKSFGGAFIAMGSKGLGADAVYAWPDAQMDVMGATAAVEILHRRELAAIESASERAELLTRLVAEHEATTGGLARAVECGAVDEIIEPALTRRRIAESLAQLDAQFSPAAVHRNPPL